MAILSVDNLTIMSWSHDKCDTVAVLLVRGLHLEALCASVRRSGLNLAAPQAQWRGLGGTMCRMGKTERVESTRTHTSSLTTSTFKNPERITSHQGGIF